MIPEDMRPVLDAIARALHAGTPLPMEHQVVVLRALEAAHDTEGTTAALRETNRTLMANNKLRYHEIEKLKAQMRTMRARITKLQKNIEQRNKGGTHDAG